MKPQSKIKDAIDKLRSQFEVSEHFTINDTSIIDNRYSFGVSVFEKSKYKYSKNIVVVL